MWLPVGVGDQLPVPRRPALLAGRAHRRPARQRLRHAAARLGARADDGQRARDARRDAAHAPAAAGQRPARQRRAASAGCSSRSPPARWSARRSARWRCGSAASSPTTQIAHVWRTWWLGDFAGALVVVPLAIAWFRPSRLDGWNGGLIEGAIVLLGRRRPDRPRVQHERAAHLRRLPGADLGRAALRPARRDGRRGGRREPDGLDTAHYDGPFSFESITRSVLSTQLYIAVSALSALCLAAVVSERERFAAAPRRVARAARRGGRHGAAPARARPPRRRAAAAHGARRAAARRAADAREDPSAPRRCSTRPSAELSLAIDELRQLARGLHPAVLTELGLAQRDPRRRRALGRCRSRSSSSRRPACDDTVEATAYFVFAEAVTNAQQARRRDGDPRPRSRSPARTCASRSPTTASAARSRARAPASRACATASRRSAARSPSTARPGSGTRVSARDPARERRRRRRALRAPAHRRAAAVRADLNRPVR